MTDGGDTRPSDVPMTIAEMLDEYTWWIQAADRWPGEFHAELQLSVIYRYAIEHLDDPWAMGLRVALHRAYRAAEAAYNEENGTDTDGA